MKAFGKKMTESFVSVLPVTLIVLIINLTPLVSLSAKEITVFLVSALFMVTGMALFNLGAELAMTPMGEHIGEGLTKSRKISVLLSVAFLMGVFITIAEPDLSVLSSQVSDAINSTLLIVSVALGVGLLLVVAILKIITGKSLSMILMFFYLVLFALTAITLSNGNTTFLPLSFDSGGVTTGPITVPFIMALGVGIAGTIGGKNTGENSFGLIALCSVGPIIAVLGLTTFSKGNIDYSLPDYSIDSKLGINLFKTFASTAGDVALSLALIIIFFAVLQIFFLKLPKKQLLRMTIGIAYTFSGLVLFLSAVSVGFVPAGYKIGRELAESSSTYAVIFGFVIGAVVVLAEPAIQVLNRQVEDVTDKMVSKTSMMIALSLGVGISIGLSIIRIIFDFSILYYLVPGYVISLGLSLFVPGIYTSIAFDSGGACSGPLTSGFVLPFAIGVCAVIQGESNILSGAFGIVAMVAMTPLIAIQVLGFRAIMTKKVNNSIAMKKILSADDEQIIDFM